MMLLVGETMKDQPAFLHLLAFCLLGTCLPLLARPADAPATELPAAPGSVVTTITPHPGYFTEPSVAVNPRNPQQVVAAFQDDAHIAYSSDGGRTWNLAKGVAPPNYRVSGDVSVTFDRQGHAFLCYIAFDKLGTFNYWGRGASRNGIFIRRSLDGGKTWEANHLPVAEQPTAPGVPFEDKPYIVAETGQGSSDPKASGGTLYIGWTRWTLTASEMLLSRSTDDGKTWSAPIEIDDHPGLPRDDNGALEGFDGVTGPDGAFYAVWSDRSGIVLTASHDRGKTFSHPRMVIPTAPTMFAIEAVERANGFPQIAIDPRKGRHGRLYITWSDYRNGDLDVFCSTSDNGGRTWTAPARLNNDPLHNGADQYFQWLAVDPLDGSVNAIFYDRRRDPHNRDQIVVLARSENGGRTFQNYAWTTMPFDPGGAFMGDYNGLAALGGRVFGAWTVQPPYTQHTQPQGAAQEHHAPPRDTIIQVGIAQFSNPETY